jgi:hypothetical protein
LRSSHDDQEEYERELAAFYSRHEQAVHHARPGASPRSFG